jgi:hypothetical protein
MAKYASTLINIAKGWLGCNEKDGSHKKIIDIYNAHKPLARGYKVKYSDHWCATFVSACSIKAEMTDIIPTECGCGQMIELFKQKGIWKEADNYVPSPGDIIMYDWDDNGTGDNTGWPDHVGIVESCDGTNIVIIEGNKNEVVSRRNLKVNGKYIRGYGAPKFDKEPEKETSKPIKRVLAKDSAKGFNKELAGTYKTTGSLHLRHGAGITKKSMIVIPKGTTVKNYGYYTSVLGTKWLYIQVTLDGVQYIGFSSSKYLKK